MTQPSNTSPVPAEREPSAGLPPGWLLLNLLVFVSGLSTLVYEILWTRMLTLVFGTSVFAVSTVLTAFMAGLALGSAWFGRLVDRRGRGLAIYAGLEAGIGLFALVFPLLLVRLDDFYTAAYRAMDGDTALFSLVRFAVSFLLLVVPTTLMGGTIPVLARYLTRRMSRVGRVVGALYAVNTLGAVVGCVAAAFFLIERAGVSGATRVAALLNLAVAAGALALDWRLGRAGSPAAPAAERAVESTATTAGTRHGPATTRLVLVGFALSGFAALGYEVVWTRVLSVVLRLTTTQSLSLILVAFLFGLSAGGAAGSWLADRWRRPLLAFGVIEGLLGLFGLGSLAALLAAPAMAQALTLPAWSGYVVELLAVAFVVMLPPTFLMGLLLPLVGRIQVARLDSLGRRIGDVYAANTTGAIFGAFGAGFVLVPWLGSQASLQVLAWVNIAVGLTALWLEPVPRRRFPRAAPAALLLAAAAMTVLLPHGPMTRLMARAQRGATPIHAEESAGGTVHVYEFEDGHRVLKVNGAGEVPTDRAAIETFRLLGTLPMVVHPRAQQVLVVAFGGGITLAAVEAHGPRHVDCVELVPGVVRASRHFAAYNDDVFERVDRQPFELIFDDGRNHILRTDRSYDVIISDSTHPCTADSWVLYTEEFYRLCRDRLNPGGLIAQWLPLHGLTAADGRMIVRTFARVFPESTLWLTPRYAVLLGARDALRIDVDRLARALQRPDANRLLGDVDLADPVSLLSTLALDAPAIGRYTGDGPVNTDDRPYISFLDRRRAGTGSGLPMLLDLLPHLVVDAGDLLTATADQRAAIERRLRAREHTYRGFGAMMLGDRRTAHAELSGAIEVDPGEPRAPRLLRRLERGR